MTEHAEIVEMAKSLGLEGNELRAYVKETMAERREERALIRAENIRLKELSIQEKQMEAAERDKKMSMESENKKMEIEAEERRRVDEFKKEEFKLLNATKMKELEIRLAQETKVTGSEGIFRGSGEGVSNDNGRFVKIPTFKPEIDNLDGFLLRFERICETYKVKQELWSLTLARSLEGKALEVYQRMNTEDAQVYAKLKAELLKRFKLDERGYRKLFKSASREVDETMLQFIERMKRYLTQWREMAGLEESYEGMLALILKDQFLITCDNETRIYLKQQGPLALEDLVNKAQYFMDSREIDERKLMNENKVKHKESKPFMNHHKDNYRWKYTNRDTNKNYKSHFGGHQFKNGWNLANRREKYDREGSRNREYQSNGNDANKNTNWRQGNTHHKPHTMAAISCEEIKEEAIISYCYKQGDMEEERTEKCSVFTDKMYVNDKRVQSIWDTGASCNAVRKGLELPNQITKKRVKCTFANGMSEVYPTAIINLRGEGIENKVEVVVIPELVKPLIMGRPLCKFEVKSKYGDLTKNIETEREVTTKSRNRLEEEEKKENKGVESKEETMILEKCEQIDILEEKIQENRNNEKVLKKTRVDCFEWDWLKPSKYKEIGETRMEEKNIEEEELVIEREEELKTEVISMYETRSQVKNPEKERVIKPLQWKDIPFISEKPEEIKKLQREDETLKVYWEKAEGKRIEGNKEEYNGNPLFIVKKGLLYKSYKDVVQDKISTRLLIPRSLREKVMKVAHESLLTAHQGIRKTQDKICSMFYWPGIMSDVKRFVKSCEICQSALGKQGVTKAPLGHLPLIEEPFSMICVDIVGPIQPRTNAGNRYILTVIDMATRYPEAIPMKGISTEEVVDKMFEIYCRTGIPKRIHTDRGGQFTSELLNEVNRLLMIRHTMSSPYHAQGNSIVERLNGTIKTTLKKLVIEKPKEWDRYVQPMMFALRDSVHEGHGFTPFELLYGRSIRGPMKILKELWTNEEMQDETKDVYNYMIELQERIQETCKVAQQEILKTQKKNERYYNKGARYRKLEIGDKVLLMIPVKTDKLSLRWHGPYTIKEKVGDYDYRIEMGDGKIRVYHINMIKKYNERNKDVSEDTEEASISTIVTVVNDFEDGKEEEELLILYNGEKKGTYRDVIVNPELSEDKRKELNSLLREYEDIFSDIPGKTNLAEHEIKLTNDTPIKSKAYPTPYGLQKEIDKEIESMMKSDIIERSEAAYAAPLVMVKKADGTNRLCCNYKQLNQVTIFDPEPMMANEDVFNKLNGSKIYSKFDFCKGYWQIPVAENSRDLTTFICANGLFKFKVMPFGLVNSASSYNRMMRKMLEGSNNLESYVDDVLAHTKNWKDHIVTLREFFERVRRAHLTLKPKKCEIGYEEIDFLGHTIENERITPKKGSIDKIINMPKPKSKKQVRSFLGAVNYYRKFIPDCARIMQPLTDLTRKDAKAIITWNNELETAFNELKNALASKPILKLPDVEKEFVVRTDASDKAVGCVLLQEYEGVMHPIAYASKKLTEREKKYAVEEKEALALIWGVQKFNRYLYGKEFLMETDHMGLQYLKTGNVKNARVMRWSLALQDYKFRVKYIKGGDNHMADYLSRGID